MNKHLPRVISDDQRSEFFRDGVVCLRDVFDEQWIELLKTGLQKNLNAPGARSRIYDRTDDDHFFLYDSDNWQQIPEYEEFVYQSPCAQIAAELLEAESVHFFFEAVFFRSRGVTFPTPWHQDEPYWSVEGMDTVSIWKPLVPVEQQSALAFVPGSHRWSNRYRQVDLAVLNPDGQEGVDTVSFEGDDWKPFPDIESNRDKYDVVSWEMAPGDCAAFNGRIIHGGSGALSSDRELRVFNTQWLGDDVRVRFKDHGMDPDHSDKMRLGGMQTGDQLNGDIYPRLPVT